MGGYDARPARVPENFMDMTKALETLKAELSQSNPIRHFDTGATRDTDLNKIDFEGHLSPFVIQCFGEYMHKHRLLPDGSLRDSDNWQKGLPLPVYMKSLLRHTLGAWKAHRSGQVNLEDLCGILFNTMGMMHEILVRSPVDSSVQGLGENVPS